MTSRKKCLTSLAGILGFSHRKIIYSSRDFQSLMYLWRRLGFWVELRLNSKRCDSLEVPLGLFERKEAHKSKHLIKMEKDKIALL